MKFVIYLLQVSACTALFYALYFVALRKLTFFSYNRVYLLVSLVFSFVIPLIQIPEQVSPQVVSVLRHTQYIYQISPVNKELAAVNKAVIPIIATTTYQWSDAAAWLYWLVALTLAVRLICSIVIILKRSKGDEYTEIDGIKVISPKKPITNSSFLNIIFLNAKTLSEEEIRQVLAHELWHVKLNHSIDKIIAQIARIILWFNPFAYSYLRSIGENHEFQVDKLSTNDTDSIAYASLLLKLSMHPQHYLYQGFSKAPLKTRIVMLFTNPTPSMKKLIYLLTLPLAAVSCLTFAKAPVVNVVKEQLIATMQWQHQAADTVKYRQKVPGGLRNDTWAAYRGTDEFKRDYAIFKDVLNKTVTFRVTSLIDSTSAIGKKITRYNLNNNGHNFALYTCYGEQKQLRDKLQIGDDIQIKVVGGAFGRATDQWINAGTVIKNNIEIFKASPTKVTELYPFLYEVNKVRFANGQITDITKYPNGKWKSATVEVPGGFKIKMNIQPTAPSFEKIAEGDRVVFRFVHEKRTGSKEYTVNDWVALSNDIKDYGVKNPEYFYRFYEKI